MILCAYTSEKIILNFETSTKFHKSNTLKLKWKLALCNFQICSTWMCGTHVYVTLFAVNVAHDADAARVGGLVAGGEGETRRL